MPITLKGEKYYRTNEVCKKIGISRSTLFRWLSQGVFEEPQSRDRRGWRLFNKKEIEIMEDNAKYIYVNNNNK